MADKTTTTESAAPMARMTVPELKAILKQRGLKQGGRKAELLARLGVAEEPGKKAAVVKQRKVVADKEGGTQSGTTRLYAYSMQVRAMEEDGGGELFKAGMSAPGRGGRGDDKGVERLDQEFGETSSLGKEKLLYDKDGNRRTILVYDMQHPTKKGTTRAFHQSAERELFTRLVARGARHVPGASPVKEHWQHTNLHTIESVLDKMVEEFGGKKLNYWDLKENKVNQLDEVAGWERGGEGYFIAVDVDSKTTRCSNHPHYKSRAIQINGKSVKEVIQLVKKKELLHGGNKEVGKPCGKSDIACILKAGYIRHSRTPV